MSNGKPSSLKRLQILSDHHKDWLDFYYSNGGSLTNTAAKFDVSDTAVSDVRDSPAGNEYATKLMGTTRATINMKVANIILSRVEASGAQIPLDVLVKVYAATLPKETANSSLDNLRGEVDRLAQEYGLKEEFKGQLLEFVITGGKGSTLRTPAPETVA